MVLKTDSFGRTWPDTPDSELCPKCGQRKKATDEECSHKRLFTADAVALGAKKRTGEDYED